MKRITLAAVLATGALALGAGPAGAAGQAFPPPSDPSCKGEFTSYLASTFGGMKNAAVLAYQAGYISAPTVQALQAALKRYCAGP